MLHRGKSDRLLERNSSQSLDELHAALMAMEHLAAKATRVLGDLTETILADLLVGRVEPWNRLESETKAVLSNAAALLAQVGIMNVELSSKGSPEHLLADARRRLVHFRQGGNRGFGFLAPRIVKDTAYVARSCLVDGRRPNDVERLAIVVASLELDRNIHELARLWPNAMLNLPSRKQVVAFAQELTNELRVLFQFFDSKHAASVTGLLAGEPTSLASPAERKAWLGAIVAELARRAARSAQENLEKVLESIRTCRSEAAHPCLAALDEAANARDFNAYRRAWDKRERVREQKELLSRYESIVEKLHHSCPGVVELLRTTAGDSEWSDRVHTIKQAWVWSNARAWLRQVSDAAAYEERIREFHRLQRRIEKTTEELVSIRAWRAFFDRLDQRTVQSLSAWTKAVGRIGRGTGKFAYRHRRTARRYLMDCVPCIPAWVMPLHRLWDMVDAKPGLFDTVIVDEASQASVDALALLLLAKRIIVVGDDKQNSPEAVGVLEDSIARLAREHLSQFRLRDEFRPDTSLFDHAERSFPSPVTLREHFRCVPEIIRFSNDLCYRDAPLIPLRQAPPNRLRALESKFVAEGACEGKGARILNRGEAAAVVEEIEKIVNDEEYRGKSIGVIALQGNAQAHLIEHDLAKRLDPETMEERRLRCGGPAAFQGDERDVIFLSLVTAPNVRHRALTTLSDQRRFNVAMSRARDQVRLFHSVRQHDLGPDDLRRRLIAFFENPVHGALRRQSEDLNRLEREARSRRLKGNQPEPYESWFEFDVALELLRLGFAVRPQVEVAGYRIDLVVEGSDARLAVECDGDAWHGAERYEHDMMRQRQLERAHWTFVRIRESAWYANRGAAVKTVVGACKFLGIRPVRAVVDAPSLPAKYASVNMTAATENHRHAEREELGEPMPAREGEEAATPAEPVPELTPRSTPHEAAMAAAENTNSLPETARTREESVHAETKRARHSSVVEGSRAVDLSDLGDLAIEIGYHVERGMRRVPDVIRVAKEAFGDGWDELKAFFPGEYEKVREVFEDEPWVAEMTPTDEVEAAMEGRLPKRPPRLRPTSGRPCPPFMKAHRRGFRGGGPEQNGESVSPCRPMHGQAISPASLREEATIGTPGCSVGYEFASSRMAARWTCSSVRRLGTQPQRRSPMQFARQPKLNPRYEPRSTRIMPQTPRWRGMPLRNLNYFGMDDMKPQNHG